MNHTISSFSASLYNSSFDWSVITNYQFKSFSYVTKNDIHIFQEEIEEFMDVLSPDTTSYEDRHKQRIEQENTKFDVEHYV